MAISKKTQGALLASLVCLALSTGTAAAATAPATSGESALSAADAKSAAASQKTPPLYWDSVFGKRQVVETKAQPVIITAADVRAEKKRAAAKSIKADQAEKAAAKAEKAEKAAAKASAAETSRPATDATSWREKAAAEAARLSGDGSAASGSAPAAQSAFPPAGRVPMQKPAADEKPVYEPLFRDEGTSRQQAGVQKVTQAQPEPPARPAVTPPAVSAPKATVTPARPPVPPLPQKPTGARAPLPELFHPDMPAAPTAGSAARKSVEPAPALLDAPTKRRPDHVVPQQQMPFPPVQKYDESERNPDRTATGRIEKPSLPSLPGQASRPEGAVRPSTPSALIPPKAGSSDKRPEVFAKVSDDAWRHIEAGILSTVHQLRSAGEDNLDSAALQLVRLLNENTALSRMEKVEYLIGIGYAINHSNLPSYRQASLIRLIADNFNTQG